MQRYFNHHIGIRWSYLYLVSIYRIGGYNRRQRERQPNITYHLYGNRHYFRL